MGGARGLGRGDGRGEDGQRRLGGLGRGSVAVADANGWVAAGHGRVAAGPAALGGGGTGLLVWHHDFRRNRVFS